MYQRQSNTDLGKRPIRGTFHCGKPTLPVFCARCSPNTHSQACTGAFEELTQLPIRLLCALKHGAAHQIIPKDISFSRGRLDLVWGVNCPVSERRDFLLVRKSPFQGLEGFGGGGWPQWAPMVSEGEHCMQVVLPTHGAEPCQDHSHPDSVHAVDRRSALCPRIPCSDFRR